MDNKKEYIQISKEDFEEIYRTINRVLKVLKKDYYDLKIAYEILNEKEKILENILNKDIIKDLYKAKTHTHIIMLSLITHYIDLNEDVKKKLINLKKNK
jgi:predicted aldo/keto reductase-like oxidoreductase